MSRDVPEPWASRMMRAGLTDPRNGRPSMTKLAEAAGTHPSTVGAMMYGTRKTSQDVIDRVAAALWPGVADAARRRREVREWVGQALETASPFEPHPDADLLTMKERQAVNELIRLLAASKRQGGEADDATTTNEPPDTGGVVVDLPKPSHEPASPSRQRPAARRTGKGTARQRGETTD